MEWAVETLLPWKVWKLASAIEEEDGALVINDENSHDLFATLTLYLLSGHKNLFD